MTLRPAEAILAEQLREGITKRELTAGRHGGTVGVASAVRAIEKAQREAWSAALRASPNGMTEGEKVEWGYPRDVAHLIQQLRTLDQSLQVYGGFHVDLRGKRRAKVKGLSFSREHVVYPFIEPNGAGPWSLVFWTAADLPPGYVAVPIEPTREMLDAVLGPLNLKSGEEYADTKKHLAFDYRTMLAVSPYPPEGVSDDA
jgi:hypothetical protein